MGQFVDGLKFAGGSHSLMPKDFIKEVTDIAHKYDVYVSTGDWAEHLRGKGPSAFKEYIEVSTKIIIIFSIVYLSIKFNFFLCVTLQECKQLGFDTIELNVNSLAIPEETLLRFVRLIKSGGMKAKPQFALKINKSDIPIGGDRAFGAYIVPQCRTHGM